MNTRTIHRTGRPALWLALALLLVGMLLAAPAGIALAQEDSPFGADVVTATTTRNLNIRNAPSLDAEILDLLPAGTVVGFTGLTDASGEWVQVDAADGPTGWVWAAFLSNVPGGLTVWTGDEAAAEDETAAEEEAAAQEQASPFGADVVTAATAFNINIRNAPSLDAEILDLLPAGTVVGFTGLTDASGEWVQVDAADGPTGWVWATYLSNVPAGLTVWTGDETAAKDETAAEDETAAQESPFGADVVTATTTRNINIRNAPSLDGDVLALLPAGTVVGFTGLTDASGQWVQVDAADGPIGWVWAAFLSNVPADLTTWSADEGG